MDKLLKHRNFFKYSKTLPAGIKDAHWEKLPWLVSFFEARFLELNRNTSLAPSYYIDINGKEWIIIMRPVRQQVVVTPDNYDSFLYDIKRKQYFGFIKNFETDINQRFNIRHTLGKTRGRANTSTSYVIDNENHVLYWLESDHYNNYNSNNICQTSLVAINIKHLNNIKLIHQTIIPQDEFPLFINRVWTMLVIGNTIQFILGGNNDCSDGKAHFEYDIKLQKLKMLDENILLTTTSHVSENKIFNFFENLKVNDWIDTRDDYGTFYLGQVLDIKDKEFENDGGKLKLKSMKIFVHYNGCLSKCDEWIRISLSSLCNCTDKCHFLNDKYYAKRGWSKLKPIKAQFSQFHRIALPKTQSLWNQYLNGFNGIYSKYREKMILFGRNDKCCGVYFKHKMRYDEKKCKLIVFGVCRQSENEKMFIPKEIRQLILKYYAGPSDEKWQNVCKKHKNGTIIRDMFNDAFYLHSGFILANNDNDIFIFGGEMSKCHQGGDHLFKHSNCILKFNIAANELVRLTDIQCPEYSDGEKVDGWHAVLCQKSKQVHLFAKTLYKHFSISLQTLNNSKSVLVDSPLLA